MTSGETILALLLGVGVICSITLFVILARLIRKNK
ncbi:Secreted protein with PEP-CTERM sorting signal OS=Eoetvoesiella caeni OX=645616 GN=DFR37_102156 PE=4 SV=1 [Eoetvoesiella caeni]|uniref:Uncharacterized protein n=1 Tax=Eoetvoesiella caeni TaxID=645616 RepID=A0A366HIF9_9BURK|nr:hypothetical protein DFR37_102156 [Eoetvoesiella caeni]